MTPGRCPFPARGLLVAIVAISVLPARADWIATGGPVGGLGYDVRIHPSSPATMLVTDNNAGVIRSTDGGKTWRASNTGINVTAGPTGDAIPIFSLTLDPNNPDIVWAGTNSGGASFGVFKSTDGGLTWSARNNGLTDPGFGLVFRGFTVQPGNSNIVYAQAEEPTAVDGREFNRVRGRVYQTIDGGANWSLLWTGENLARYLLIDPGNNNHLYLSTGIFDREANNSDCAAGVGAAGGVGVLASTNGGANWSPVNNGLTDLYIGSLRMHPTDPTILFAATGNNACSGAAEGNIVSGLFRSTDGGANWSKVVADDILTTVNFAPSNPDIVYAGSATAFYRSSNGGVTWTKLNKPSASEWGPEGVRAGVPIDVIVDAADANRLYANNYGGGVFRSSDGAQTWEIWSRGYSGADVHQVAIPAGSGGRVLAIGRSGPFASDNYGLDWRGIGTGAANYPEWYAVAAHPANDPVIVIADEHQGVILRSVDNGASFSLSLRHPDANASNVATRQGFRTLAFAPGDGNIVYAGLAKERGSIDTSTPVGRTIYKSTDGGATFVPAGAGLDGKNIYQLVVHPTDADTLWAATSTGLYKSIDGGAVWTVFAPLDNRRILAVAVDGGRLLASEKDAGVWRSADGGAIWAGPSIAGITVATPSIFALLFDPVTSGVAYAGDFYSGVYRSADDGASWSPFPDNPMTGLANKAVKSLVWRDGVLYAATQGGGVFRSGGPRVIPTATALALGSVNVGASGAQTVTVYNTGNAALAINSVSLSGADAAEFAIQDNTCAGALTAHAACTLSVVFAPVSAGDKTATLAIASSDPASPYAVTVAGTGNAVASDAPGGGGGGGCFIATAAYGSHLHPHVETLRAFRDRYLVTHAPGRALVAVYYRFSPPAAAWIAEAPWRRGAARALLAPLVAVIAYPALTALAIVPALLIWTGKRRRRRVSG